MLESFWIKRGQVPWLSAQCSIPHRIAHYLRRVVGSDSFNFPLDTISLKELSLFLFIPNVVVDPVKSDILVTSHVVGLIFWPRPRHDIKINFRSRWICVIFATNYSCRYLYFPVTLFGITILQFVAVWHIKSVLHKKKAARAPVIFFRTWACEARSGVASLHDNTWSRINHLKDDEVAWNEDFRWDILYDVDVAVDSWQAWKLKSGEPSPSRRFSQVFWFFDFKIRDPLPSSRFGLFWSCESFIFCSWTYPPD